MKGGLRCTTCKGRGTVPDTVRVKDVRRVLCPTCKGTGRVKPPVTTGRMRTPRQQPNLQNLLGTLADQLDKAFEKGTLK